MITVLCMYYRHNSTNWVGIVFYYYFFFFTPHLASTTRFRVTTVKCIIIIRVYKCVYIAPEVWQCCVNRVKYY